MNLNPKYYVYEWVRPDYDLVFYVGKGTKNRAHDFEYNRNRHTKSVIIGLEKKGMKPCVRIIARFINEDSAYDFEEERIAFWGLENLTNELPGGKNGGGGMSGKKHTSETKIKIGASQKGKVISLEQRRKLRDANLGKKHAPESCEKMSKSRLGRPCPMKGKKHTQEAKDKMSATRKGRPSPNKGNKFSEESKAKLSEQRRGSGNSNSIITEEIARKIYAAQGTISQIARDFGLRRHIVDSVKKKVTWKHIHNEILL